VEQNLQQPDDAGLVDFDAGITNRADGKGECDALQQREVHVNVEPLGLATRESVRDGLKLLAHGVQVVEAFLQAEVTQVVRADLVAQEGRELFVLLEEGVLPVGSVDMMAVLDLLDDRAQLAAKLLSQTNAENLTDLMAVRRHSPSSQERSKALWMGKWRLKMKLRQYSIWLIA
jgi:hypothetical protein